jgi:hypothetical protein
MYLTLQRRTCLWLCLEKRIVRVENVVEEEEYNQFDKIRSFDTSYKPHLLGTNKTPYLRSDHSEKIHIQKSRKKWNPFFKIKDAMYWWNFNPFCDIGDVVEFESSL